MQFKNLRTINVLLPNRLLIILKKGFFYLKTIKKIVWLKIKFKKIIA